MIAAQNPFPGEGRGPGAGGFAVRNRGVRGLEPHRADDKKALQPLWKRLAWFVGLWAAGVAAVGAVAFILRWWL